MNKQYKEKNDFAVKGKKKDAYKLLGKLNFLIRCSLFSFSYSLWHETFDFIVNQILNKANIDNPVF